MNGNHDVELVNGGTNGYGAEPGKYDVEILRAKDELPGDVDPSCKELYLADLVFEELFGMNREAFEALQQWKRIALKKKVGLF